MGVAFEGPVALDTALFIYYVEEHPLYVRLVDPFFTAADRGTSQIVTSAMTLLELLVIPYRKNDRKLAARYEELLTNSRGIRLVDVDRSQLRAAAALRALQQIRAVDALQLAAALASGCKIFMTNDRRLPAIRGLRVVQLSELA